MMRKHPEYDETRCAAYVKDITSGAMSELDGVCEGGADCFSMFFVLSAIDPGKMGAVLSEAYSRLKPGGMILFRDYAIRDLSQLRFAPGVHELARARHEFASGHKLSENFYVRGDGTRTFYFDHEFVAKIFGEAGFGLAEPIKYIKKTISNRKRQVTDMSRALRVVVCH